MTHLDLFSGIGGFALAAESVWPEIEHTFCEIDPFCQAVLRKHWPTSKIYGDIRALTNTESIKQQRGVRLERKQNQKDPKIGFVDLLTGGFPCQPFSHAGQRKGASDDRHLWPEMRRVIQEFSPAYVVGENVRGLLSIDGGLVFEQVCFDMEALGYEVQPFVIPACAINAPHRRDRVWIVAHAKYESARHEKRGRNEERASVGATGSDQDDPDPTGIHVGRGREKTKGYHREPHREGTDQRRDQWNENWPEVATRLCRMDDGFSERLDETGRISAKPKTAGREHRLKALGNAIVPQVAEQIFKAIKATSR